MSMLSNHIKFMILHHTLYSRQEITLQLIYDGSRKRDHFGGGGGGGGFVRTGDYIIPHGLFPL